MGRRPGIANDAILNVSLRIYMRKVNQIDFRSFFLNWRQSFLLISVDYSWWTAEFQPKRMIGKNMFFCPSFLPFIGNMDKMTCHETGLPIVWDTASAFHGTGSETRAVCQIRGILSCQCGKYLADIKPSFMCCDIPIRGSYHKSCVILDNYIHIYSVY